jgi:tetratricopeptide (TPR) repeat protein
MIWLPMLLLLPAPELNRLGAHAFARGDYPAAWACFARAWNLLPRTNTASNLAATARRLGNWPEAERWSTAVIGRRERELGAGHPDTIIAWNNRGEARLRLGRLDGARVDLEHALRLVTPGSSDHAIVLHNLAVLHWREGRSSAAQNLLEQSVAIRPGDPGTLALLGEVLIERASPRQAQRVCAGALAIAPGWEAARQCLDRVNALIVVAGSR